MQKYFLNPVCTIKETIEVYPAGREMNYRFGVISMPSLRTVIVVKTDKWSCIRTIALQRDRTITIGLGSLEDSIAGIGYMNGIKRVCCSNPNEPRGCYSYFFRIVCFSMGIGIRSADKIYWICSGITGCSPCISCTASTSDKKIPTGIYYYQAAASEGFSNLTASTVCSVAIGLVVPIPRNILLPACGERTVSQSRLFRHRNWKIIYPAGRKRIATAMGRSQRRVLLLLSGWWMISHRTITLQQYSAIPVIT